MTLHSEVHRSISKKKETGADQADEGSGDEPGGINVPTELEECFYAALQEMDADDLPPKERQYKSRAGPETQHAKKVIQESPKGLLLIRLV